MTALHVFDMDGTLLRATTAGQEISRRLGVLGEVVRAERAWESGAIDELKYALAMRHLWADLTDEIVADIAARAPWIGGIAAVCGDIRARGEASVLVTMSPGFFADHLRRHGFDAVYGTRYPSLPFTATIDPAGVLRPSDKVRITERERAVRGLRRSRCVAYGDSLSDRPLFAHLEHTVAVNADTHLEPLAAARYRGDDLLEAYARGRRLLERDAAAPARI